MEDFQFQDLETLRDKQWKLLKAQLKYIDENSPYYKKLFKEKAILINEIDSVEDFKKIPVTTKEDLQLYNSEFISVPPADIIDFVTTSGILGSPVNFALNDADLERLAENEYRSFRQVGVNKTDKVQITTTLDKRFMAGLAYFLGLRKLGAGIIRTGSGLPQLQWESIERFKPEYLVAVPSFLLKMIMYARENNIDYKKSSVKAAICIGEPLRMQNFNLNALGEKITDLWDIELFSTYASTEMSTAFTECAVHSGNHIPTDLIYTEILNGNGEQVEPGETGELIVTPLGTQTMPLVRFATGDMLTYYESQCKCGRNSYRLSSVIGRKQQKIKLKGTSLYPQHIIEVINSFGKIRSFVIEAKKDDLDNDVITVKFAEPISHAERLKDYFKSQLHVTPLIEHVSEEELEKLKFPKGSRKPHIFRDLR